MMKRILIAILVLRGFMATGQCDLAITDFNFTTGDLVVEVINSENCGCNDLTTIGNTCENTGSSVVQNNTDVSHLVFGLHLNGIDYPYYDCLTANNHPGWTFKVKSFFGNGVLETGDTWSTNIYDFWAPTNECWAELLANQTECIELVVWQINLSQTLEIADGGWAAFPNSGNQTQNYPDVDISNNIVTMCPVIDPEPCDTVYINTIDTLYIDNFITDTLYVDVEVYITDTLYITEIEYVTDTLYITTIDTVEVIVYEFLTDTIYEYITIDCETGLECVDDPGLVCPDWTSVYIPNTFTPNNDGNNDVWKMIYDLNCWQDVEFKIFNRWGNQIYQSYGDYFDSYPYWDGSINGGNNYAIDGVYTYTFYAKKLNSVEVFQRHGHITIFR